MSGIRVSGHALFFILAVAIVTVLCSRHPTESGKDPRTNRKPSMSAAYTLATFGIIDSGYYKRSPRSLAPRPGNRREPLYPLIWSAITVSDPAEDTYANGWPCFDTHDLCPSTMFCTKSVNCLVYSLTTLTLGVAA
jgi:hypothetical protein